MWYGAIYVNEFTVLLPGLLWGSVRRTGGQKVLDVMRTAPLLAFIASASAGVWWGWTGAGILAAYCVVTNVAMAACDRAQSQPFDATVYFLSHASVIAWVTGTATASRYVRAVSVCLNLLAVGTLVFSLTFAVPFMQAWMCYSSPRDPASLTKGYCPQYTGDYVGNKACSFTVIDSDQTTHAVGNPRCNPATWGEYTTCLLYTSPSPRDS